MHKLGFVLKIAPLLLLFFYWNSQTKAKLRCFIANTKKSLKMQPTSAVFPHVSELLSRCWKSNLDAGREASFHLVTISCFCLFQPFDWFNFFALLCDCKGVEFFALDCVDLLVCFEVPYMKKAQNTFLYLNSNFETSTILGSCVYFKLENFAVLLAFMSSSFFHYTRCITPKRVMSFAGPSSCHYACGQHSFFWRNIAARASPWQHGVRFNGTEMWTTDFPLQRRTCYRSTNWVYDMTLFFALP